MGDFPEFAQTMSDIGLVFSITFTEAELEGQASWSLFNKKIMEGISSLPANLVLPCSRSTRQPNNANATLWTIVNCHLVRPPCQAPREYWFERPPSIPVASYTLGEINRQFAVDNPISRPDDSPVPSRLLVIGAPSLCQLIWP